VDPLVITLLVVLGVGVIAVLWTITMYNGLVKLKNMVKNAWAQIDVQLKRRHDLIPNLVETVKGYAGHEKQTLTDVIEARSKATSAQGIGDQIEAENQLSGALGRLLLVVEQYPDLKANENFLSLQEELTSTENRIGFSRQHYNDSVMGYNTKLEQFPNNVIAGVFNFKQGDFFELKDEKQREVPNVTF
jgi:LemA protein